MTQRFPGASEAQTEKFNLRLSIGQPELHQEICNLEGFDFPYNTQSQTYYKNLYLFSQKLISYDKSDEIDGYSHSESKLKQYGVLINNISQAGMHKFDIDKRLTLLGHPDVKDQIFGFGLTVTTTEHTARQMTTSPYPSDEAERTTNKIKFRYELTKPLDFTNISLDGLLKALDSGAWASQLALVPNSGQLARQRDIFMKPAVRY